MLRDLFQFLTSSALCPLLTAPQRIKYSVRTTRICMLGHLPSTLPPIPAAALHDIRSKYMAGWHNKPEPCMNKSNNTSYSAYTISHF